MAGLENSPGGMDILNSCMTGMEIPLLEWISPTIVWQDWKIPLREWISRTIVWQEWKIPLLERIFPTIVRLDWKIPLLEGTSPTRAVLEDSPSWLISSTSVFQFRDGRTIYVEGLVGLVSDMGRKIYAITKEDWTILMEGEVGEESCTPTGGKTEPTSKVKKKL